jgi:choice-of-anchor B domain-containing protein
MKIQFDKSIYSLFLFFSLSIAAAQTNVTFQSNVPMGTEGQSADVWGYIKNGIEYAIIGTQNSFRIYSLEDPTSPTHRATIPGDNTSWRDMKSFGDYIYGVQDVNGDDGLLIVDMSGAPNTITHSFWTPTLTVDGVTAQLQQVHNLFIDENGYGYLSGSNIATGGIIILDLFTNPTSPTHLGEADINYSHDVYVRNDTMYTSEIYAKRFRVFDVTDKTNPVPLATQMTGREFTHNTWISDNGNVIFTTDEKTNAYVESYDISDLSNIKFLDKWRPLATVGTNVIPHNVHVLNDFLVISHYSDGVIIVDAAQPDNLIEVGQYDTYTAGGTGFRGCWGAYPFLPSGLLLASDIESGLFVLDPTYVRACYLRGQVRDINTNALIINADVDILAPDLNDGKTNNFGHYATGVATAGSYPVVFSHPAYPSDTFYLDFVNGQSIELNVFLGDYTGPCLTSRSLSDTLTSEAFFANQSISSDALIPSGAVVEFHANDSISLLPEFEVALGGALVVDTLGCN